MAKRAADEPARDGKGRRSRRELLTGAAAALGVVGAETLVRATPAQAGTDGDVVLGAHNFTGSTTVIDTTIGANVLGLYTEAANALAAVNGSDLYGGEGVYAQVGSTFGTNYGKTRNAVHGVTNSPTDSGVWGENVNGGTGAFGSTASTGISGGAGVGGLNTGTGPGTTGSSIGGASVFARSNTAEGLYARSGTTDGSTPGATKSGVHGVTNGAADAGVWGENVNHGWGVIGSTTSTDLGAPAGVAGDNGGTGPGVRGTSHGGAALHGDAPFNTEGLYAQSGVLSGTNAGVTRSGVHGVTNSPTDAAVWGENVGGGAGVKGTTGGGIGLLGLASSGGVGVFAQNAAGGTALQVIGPSLFSRSGTVVIPSGQKTATVTPPGGLSASALVLATMQNIAGGVLIKAAVPNPGAGTVQITLNKAPLSPATATVAWFVVN